MDYYAEQILVISFDESGDIIIDNAVGRPITNHAKVQRDRLKVDSLKWTASRLFPKRYGGRQVPTEICLGTEPSEGRLL
jgi:hypothetical protein